MPAPKKGYSLGSNPSHQGLMLRNLARSLFQHERLRTTEAKAKLLRPYAEKLITKAKDGSVHHRRLVLSEIQDRTVVHKLFDEIGPRFGARDGGYTRILKLGQRPGDGAPMALIELVEHAEAPTVPAAEEGPKRRLRRPGRRRGEGLPQDKPVLSRGEEAHAAGQAPPEGDEAAAREAAEAASAQAHEVPSQQPTAIEGAEPARQETRSEQESKQD